MVKKSSQRKSVVEHTKGSITLL